MTAILFIIAFFILGYIFGFTFGKYRNKRLVKEAYVMGYRECNKKWINRSTEEALKRLKRRKTNNEIGSR